MWSFERAFVANQPRDADHRGARLVGISLQGSDPFVEVGAGNRISFSSSVRDDLLTFDNNRSNFFTVSPARLPLIDLQSTQLQATT